MEDEELCKWLRDNSSGIYRNSEIGALRIEELLKENEELKSKLKEILEGDCWYCGAVQYGHDSETRIEVEKLTGTYE